MTRQPHFDILLIQILSTIAVDYVLSVPHTNYLINDYEGIYLNKWNHFDGQQTAVVIPKKGADLTPAEYMIDLTNDLCYRIIHYHSVLNRNNFAFSPTALMSIMIALYEGSTGHSAMEIKSNLLLPNNRNTIRIGYRDIHRRLRTYFFDTDNPLKGLSLNKENVTITRSFGNLLEFYGYDLSVDMQTSVPVESSKRTGKMYDTPMDMKMETSSEKSLTSTNGIQNKIPEATATMPATMPPTTTSTSTSISTTTTSTTTIISTTSEALPLTTLRSTTEVVESTSASISNDSNSSSPTTTLPEPTTTTLAGAASNTDVAEIRVNEEASELIAPSITANGNSEQFARIQKAQKVNRLPSSRPQTALANASLPKRNYLPAKEKHSPPSFLNISSRSKRIKRTKRYLIGLKNVNPNQIAAWLHQFDGDADGDGGGGSGSGTFATIDPNFIASLAFKQNYNTDVISHVFYLDSEHTIYTTFKVYSAVLYYKYFLSLHMSVIELELDTVEYNLLIILPDFHTDMTAAAASLRLAPKLRHLRKQLKPKWVQAIIPDFKFHGDIFLTNDLQNMGITEIFEPNHADFRPMSFDKGIYVRHIKQSISVHIRTHPINQLRRAKEQQTQPIQISVNHPFLFFIVDRDLDIAVMAGRILNPLNVRIQ